MIKHNHYDILESDSNITRAGFYRSGNLEPL
jgi:hypothetical protein